MSAATARPSEPGAVVFRGARSHGHPLRPNEPEKSRRDKGLLAISRRALLRGSAEIASLAAIGAMTTACAGDAPALGEPESAAGGPADDETWSDDTLWHDGTGWID